MTKTTTAVLHRQIAERQLFDARRALSHLVEMYDSGRWRLVYKEDGFAEAVREAKAAIDHWAEIVAKCSANEGGRA